MIIKDYNSGMGDVDLLDQKKAAYKLDCESSCGPYCTRLLFDLIDISVVNSHIIYKELNPKGIELLDLAKLLVGTYDSCS